MELHQDNPINKYEDDIFDRKRIADKLVTFINQRSEKAESNSFCIGVYGKWGEGKTSLMNMTIDKLMENKKDNIVISQYNPWLLKDQESILYDFFNTISNEDLGTKTIKFLKEYGAILSLGLEGILSLSATPLVEKAASFSINKIIKALPNSKQTVSQLKKKVNDSIKVSGKHLVIFVDDLDRLDREEMHAVLKLIRQNTDFENTTYILMMDYEIVSSSLQSKYGDGDNNAGREFLSKIIQFPLHLPQIQEHHLEVFLFQKLEKLFSTLNVNDIVYKEAIEKAKSDIKLYVLPLISTPREIIQYINILSFVVPTMYKELNLSDLCLLEALKKFSIKCYSKIKESKSLLLEINNKESLVFDYLLRNKRTEKEIQDERTENVANICSIDNNKKINSIINCLLDDYIQGKQREEGIYKNRLCNINFFDKYFIYDTPIDSVSQQLINEIEKLVINNKEEYLISLFNDIDSNYRSGEIRRIVKELIDKTLQFSPNNIDVISTNISIVISKMVISNSIENLSSIMACNNAWTVYNDIFNKLFIGETFNRDRNYSLIKSIIKKIYEEGGLIFSLYMHLEFYKGSYLKLDYKELFEILIRRFIEEKGKLEIFNFENTLIKQSLIIEYSKYLRDEYLETRDRVMKNEELDIVRLIYCFIMDKNEDSLTNMQKYFDIKVLYDKVKDIDLSGEFKDYKEYIDFFIQNSN